jgi:phosphatidylserine decarboxylase
MTIHKEGYTPIALCILFIFLLNAFLQFYFPGANAVKWIVYILSFVFFAGTLLFFRNPKINVSIDEKTVFSPADGKITAIEEVDESEFLKGRYTRITIAISPLDVHVTRNPVNGTVKYIKYNPGNKYTTVAVANSKGNNILLRQLAGPLSQRVLVDIKEGDVVKQGEPFGFGSLLSQIDVFLPVGASVAVDVDDVVKGGITALAQSIN